MRTEPFRREIQWIRKTIHHAFHDRMHSQGPTSTAWHRIAEERQFRPRLTIYDTMQKCPISVRPESPLAHALALMIENEISGLPVVDAEGRIVGLLAESDLLKIFYEPDATDVASVMTRDPTVVSVRAPLVDLVDQLMASDLRRVLVHKDGKLVGIITRAHLMPTILEHLAEEAHNRLSAWARAADARVSH